jgi:DNA-binding CsgD family transcriptional regulator
VARGGQATGMRARTPVRRRPARHGLVSDRPATSDLPISRATDREVVVVAAVLAAGSEKAAAHRLGLSHSTVKHHLANARSKVRLTPAAYRHGLALALPDADWRARQVLDARLQPIASRSRTVRTGRRPRGSDQHDQHVSGPHHRAGRHRPSSAPTRPTRGGSARRISTPGSAASDIGRASSRCRLCVPRSPPCRLPESRTPTS